ncbi:leucine-rich repeat domain-containing protein [Parabacteroides bouchesdurhonensis]|uniref:leucine-rich repeat domain-containing protein n=1 Tax=Parabacteroides bouchesdurhonensis TaxID=1936995 RepID=UPI001D0C8141|nr:leucine-rich repeat domain-containing protein [Parabacteroides bouchesdurhonensis]
MSIIPFLLLFTATCMPDTAWGQAPISDTNGTGLFFEILATTPNPNTAKIVAKSPNDKYTGDITIPVKVSDQGTEYDVVEIGEEAFRECKTLTSVTFAEGSKVETIGKLAFFKCSDLQSITIPSSVITIGESAFQQTGLTSVTFRTE